MRVAILPLVILLVQLSITTFSFTQSEATPRITSRISEVMVLKRKQVDDMQRRAEAGEAEAQFVVGAIYRQGGLLGPKNDTEAYRWFRKSADQNFIKAEIALGDAYAFGSGVPQSYEQAALWYTKAAQKGDPVAANDLGVLYHLGLGVTRSNSRSIEWFGRAAGKGLAAAQFALGYMYQTGQGLQRDLSRAAKFHLAAAQQGFARAQSRRHSHFGKPVRHLAHHIKGAFGSENHPSFPAALRAQGIVPEMRIVRRILQLK